MGKSNGTESADYTTRLRSSEAWWKRALGVQKVYAWNLRRLDPGFMLDVGCGIGRNLRAVHGNGVGVDHNPHSVEHARANGFIAYTADAFLGSEYAVLGRFDSILVSHVFEHLSESEAEGLISSYLPFLRMGGQFISITPQERGYASDHTHQRFVGFEEVERLFQRASLQLRTRRSFPFPRAAGSLFTYNEFVLAARKV